MEQPTMPYKAQEDMVESLDHHKTERRLTWYHCSSCRDYIEYMVQVYGTEKIEFIINAYESGLLETIYTPDKDARYFYEYPIYFMGERVEDLFSNK